MSEHRTTGCTRLLSLIGLALVPIVAIGCGTPPRKPSSPSPWPLSVPPRSRPRLFRLSSSWISRRKPGSGSSMPTVPSARSSFPKRWARASRSSTTTATATRTCCSSTRRPWPGHEAKPAPTQALYRNDGKGHFEDVTKQAGLDKTFYGQGVAVGDYDNDGDPDLYITAIGGGHLFRNDGKGHFDDATEAAHAKGPNGWLTGAAFLDIDNDGDLDLFLCNYITWTPEIDKVQGFQISGLGRAYGPPTSFPGSLCALLRNDSASSPTSARSRAFRFARPT